MDSHDNPFFRNKPSTRIHHPPGGGNSGKLWDTMDDNRVIKEETKIECTLKDKTEDENHNIGAAMLNACSDKSIEIKTTIVVHNPPGGKSSLTLG